MRREIYCFFLNLRKILFLLKKMKSLLTLYFSIEISSFWPLSYWNLYFLTTFLLKSLLSEYFSIEISTFSLLSIEISSFWPLRYWNLDFLSTFLLKSLLSLYFSIEISTFSLLFYWNLLFLTTFLLKSLLSESSKTKRNQKDPRKTKKKHLLTSNQNILLRVLVFCFFGFSFCFGSSRIQKNTKTSRFGRWAAEDIQRKTNFT